MKLYYNHTKVSNDREDAKAYYKLWQDIFNDPEAFADYYFKEKYKDNEVLAVEMDGKLVGMTHLNPYQFQVAKEEHTIQYIVGVSTLEEYRRQGIMRAMIEKIIRDLSDKGELFTFLMPAKEAYYTPFNFAFIYDRYLYKTKAIGAEEEVHAASVDGWDKSSGFVGTNWSIRSFTDFNCKDLIDFCHGYWDKHFQVAPIRDRSYFKRLEREVACEDGKINLLYNKDELIGFFTYALEDKTMHIRELITSSEREEVISYIRCEYNDYNIEFSLDWFHSWELGEKKPMIMVRILNVIQLLTLIKGRCNNRIIITINDPILPINNGCFLWQLNKSGSMVSRCQDSPSYAIDINDLTQIIFGYSTGKCSEIPGFFQDITPLDQIFISEIV